MRARCCAADRTAAAQARRAPRTSSTRSLWVTRCAAALRATVAWLGSPDRAPFPSAGLEWPSRATCASRRWQPSSRDPLCRGWPLAAVAGALRMPPHPAGGLPSPTASAECVARDRTGCLPAASHTRAHSRFLTRGSSPRALCLEPADHQGRDPLELFELCSLVPVSWRCGHRVGGPGRALGVDVCPGPPLYSDSCTGSSDM